jgi:L,D-transpeptidase ErfK/SrfK
MSKWFNSFLLLLMPMLCFALEFPLGQSNVVGETQTARVHINDTFHLLARKNHIGFDAMMAANPHMNPDKPRLWWEIQVPTQFILPAVPHEGIVINLPERNLYYFPKDKNVVYIYPIGIGNEGWETPLGKMNIIEKIKEPTWHVPKSIKEALAQKGKIVGDEVPPGPENPLGKFAMRLTNRNYLIHGTNSPESIGMRGSSGCIRLYPEDIEELFSMVPNGTSVLIIDAPYKVGLRDGKLYLQAYKPLVEDTQYENNLRPMATSVTDALTEAGTVGMTVNWQKAIQVAQEHNGIPDEIGNMKKN